MELELILELIEEGKEEARAIRQAAEAARQAARDWANRLIRNTPSVEIRALGRSVGLGEIPRSPLLASLLILAASGSPDAARALRALGARGGIVEVGDRGKAVIAFPSGRVVFEFSPPAACRGAWFSWGQTPAPKAPKTKVPKTQVPEAKAPELAQEAPASIGARARLTRAR